MGYDSQPPVSVVVPTHNRRVRLARLLAALEQQSYGGGRFEVVVVDDGSTDGTHALLRERAETCPPRLRVVRHEVATGPAAARNDGWRAAEHDLVAFTDDDCEPEPRWLEAGVAALIADPGIGVVQGQTLPEPGVEERAFSATRRIVAPSPFFEGCNLFFRRAALEATDGFDERLRMGCEDTALGWAVLRGGWRRAFAPDAVVRHAITEPGLRWHLREGLMRRNVVAVATRYPEFRAALWRPWAISPRTAAFAAAVVGATAAPAWRPALALAAPYLWINRPMRPARRWLAGTLAHGVMDAFNLAGTAVGSVRERTILV